MLHWQKKKDRCYSMNYQQNQLWARTQLRSQQITKRNRRSLNTHFQELVKESLPFLYKCWYMNRLCFNWLSKHTTPQVIIWVTAGNIATNLTRCSICSNYGKVSKIWLELSKTTAYIWSTATNISILHCNKKEERQMNASYQDKKSL